MELLIKRAQKGDSEAFIEAINEYMPQIYKVARCRLKNEEDIGDAVQETIIAAFYSLKSLKKILYFKTWIIKILINKCNNVYEKNKTVYVEDFDKINVIDFDSVSTEDINEELDFDNILSKLNDEYRLVIVMFYVNRFNTREISEILNEKEGTIKSRLSRARQQLKAHYINKECEKSYVGGSLN